MTKRIVAISQPMYFPWPGFMEMMALADTFIWLDDAQFSKGSFTNRIQVCSDVGTNWMTIPLENKGRFTPIRDLKASGADWAASHRSLLANSLRGYKHSSVALDIFDKTCNTNENLCHLLIASSEELAKYIGVAPKHTVRSSELGVEGASWRRVLDLVKAVGGDTYVSGAGGASYLDHDAFNVEGVSVEYMSYSLNTWDQGRAESTPFVSSLDLIAAEGTRASEFLHPKSVGWQEFLAKRREADE